MTAYSARTTLSSIDDQLGPADRRFFGSGFRRVRYDLGRLHVSRTSDHTAQALCSVGVRYPADWSRKAPGTDLRPHFSTLDGLVIAAQLAEACLTGPEGGTEHRDAWLRSVRLTAGSRPQEDLDQLPASATLRCTEPAPGDAARWLSVVDCRIGTMRVSCEVDHRPLPTATGEAVHDDFSALLGPAARRYYGEGFTRRRQLVRDVEVDHEQLRATAALDVLTEGVATAPVDGLEGDYQPAATTVDAFVTALQLAQVMLYDLDGVPRQHSDTLWMRQTTMTASRPDRPCGDIPVMTRLENTNLLRMSGDTWRTVDVDAELAGIHLRSALTHRLPKENTTP